MFDSNLIKSKKNLLAFSAGVDSSALFYILLNKNINFDVAIVNYNLRDQSIHEINYAKQLAKKYNKKIYIKIFDDNNFNEKKARDFRYAFFDEIINKNDYESLITAHQLNDKLEWFLMQLSKGAGLFELLGLEKISLRKDYLVYKPLLEIRKETLVSYLKSNSYKYFIDETNNQNIYKRNKIRNNFSDNFLNEFENGIKKSFEYLNNDIKSLSIIENELNFYELSITKFKSFDMNIIIRHIDKSLKKFGIIISFDTRNEIIRQKKIIISNKIAISIVNNIVYISPFTYNSMNKNFKELCRINKIPNNIRTYLNNFEIEEVNSFINKLSKF